MKHRQAQILASMPLFMQVSLAKMRDQILRWLQELKFHA
jgi:hypothetical protein